MINLTSRKHRRLHSGTQEINAMGFDILHAIYRSQTFFAARNNTSVAETRAKDNQERQPSPAAPQREQVRVTPLSPIRVADVRDGDACPPET